MNVHNDGFVEERSIRVSTDSVLRVKMTETFLSQVRKQFDLRDDHPVTDDYVKLYILHATKNALNKINHNNGKVE